MFCVAGTGLTAPVGECTAGYYCPGGQESETPLGLECWAGHFCEVGSATPVFCPNGTYQPSAGQWECLPCDPGFYCNLGAGKTYNCIGHLL